MPAPKVLKTENHVKTALKEALDAIPGCFHFPASAGAFSVGGISDRLGVCRGRFFAIEAKRPGRRGEKNEGLSGLQVQFGKSVRRAGGLFFVVDSHGSIAEIAELLGELDSLLCWDCK